MLHQFERSIGSFSGTETCMPVAAYRRHVAAAGAD
jgi:hypothetical protein